MIPVPAVGVVCLKGDEVLLIRRGTPPEASNSSVNTRWSNLGLPLQPTQVRRCSI